MMIIEEFNKMMAENKILPVINNCQEGNLVKLLMRFCIQALKFQLVDLDKNSTFFQIANCFFFNDEKLKFFFNIANTEMQDRFMSEFRAFKEEQEQENLKECENESN